MRSKSVKYLCCSKTGSRVSMKHQESCRRWILDPESLSFIVWNRVFLVSCFIALIIDPMIFYWPMIQVITTDGSSCINLDRGLSVSVTWMRSVTDLFYLLNMVVKFHTAYTAPNSRVFAKGELVVDRKLIGRRYIKSDFSADLAASLPLTQVVTWLVIPAARNSSNVTVTLIILVQYSLRLYRTYTLTDQIIEATGVITKSAWGGAVYNLLLYLLASHIMGAIWYLFMIARQITCWKEQCQMEGMNGMTCEFRFLDCGLSSLTERQVWANGTQVFANCDVKNSSISFNYGIFSTALSFEVPSVNLVDKYCYGLWWGFQQLASSGQNMVDSPFFGETLFSVGIGMVSLILLAQLIGNMQTYLQSISARVEKWRLKQEETEEWMRHRQLPPGLQHRVRRFYQSKWLATRGVDEESILQGLPSDLRRDIKRHLCIDLVRRVSFFSEMDDLLLDAICERLVSFQSAGGTVRVREGDPVTEMLFVIRGKLRSSTAAGGGRSGLYCSTILGPGDFCGEELLPWALHPAPSQSPCQLPASARTVTVAVQAEGFALRAQDLRFMANQFRRMHSQRLQHALRYYSHQWRAWAACLVQAAWRRHRRRKAARESGQWESFVSRSDEVEGGKGGSCRHQEDGVEGGSADLRCDSRTSSRGKFTRVETMAMAKLEKPHQPDFSIYLHG